MSIITDDRPTTNIGYIEPCHARCTIIRHLLVGLHGQLINPFTLRVSLESIVCYFRTFVNNSGIKQKLSKHLKESCRLTSG